jgi:hypothetical protein
MRPLHAGLETKVVLGSNSSQGLRSLRDLTQHLTTRADDSHAAPVQSVYCYTSRLSPATRCMSSPGKVLRVASN